MASGKKADDEKRELLADSATPCPGDGDMVQLDHVPDRLLILANRLQRALDHREMSRATTGTLRRKH
ncbi:hypothetical protein ACIQUG_22050 [Ensifer sp. NPDC090286]|uniref:hypothetical protein n=1 Tax=Ensifer sp. NPDC090286 TaxID=3363991 RepID=UPI00383A7C6E